MMGLLGWAIFGLIVGALAKLVMPGRDGGGIIVTMLLGVVGAVVAGYLGQAMGLYTEGQPAGFIMSLLGAVLLLSCIAWRPGARPERSSSTPGSAFDPGAAHLQIWSWTREANISVVRARTPRWRHARA